MCVYFVRGTPRECRPLCICFLVRGGRGRARVFNKFSEWYLIPIKGLKSVVWVKCPTERALVFRD